MSLLSAGAALVMGLAVAPEPSRAEEYSSASTVGPYGQPFASDVIDEFHKLARRAEPMAAYRALGHQATDCKHQEGITRKDAADGTPYLFVTKSGKDPGVFCFVDDEPGYLSVIQMGSRKKNGERLRSNLMPLDGSALVTRPHIASQEDVVVQSIPLDGQHGFPSYMHPGGMQAIGDLLVIGTEDPFNNSTLAGHTILLVDVSDPANPVYKASLDIENAGSEGGADPVGLTLVKDGAGDLHYLLVAAGGPANKQVRFYRSPSLSTGDIWDPSAWSLVGQYTDIQLTLCLGGTYVLINGQLVPVGPHWPIGTGFFDTGQHQMINFVREGNLDGQLYMFGGRRDGAIVNPFADEFLDLYTVNLTADGMPDTCPISTVQNGLRQMGETSWGEALNTGSFSAASGMYVSPAGEIMVYEAPHENSNVILFGEFRSVNLVDNDSPTLHPTARVDGPIAVDEGSLVQMIGHGEQASTKAFVSLFQDDGAAGGLSDPVWFQVDYEDWAELGSENLQNSIRYLLDPHGNPFVSHLIWEKASSWRWFAPTGCTIAATDYPIISNSWPGPDTVLLPGTGQVEVEPDLDNLATWLPEGETWKWSPVPGGVDPTYVDYDNDIEGISFTKPIPFGDSALKQLGCDNYYHATIGLGWDLDNNGSFETTGATAYFSATQLDGPDTRTVGARAQHPTDTSDLGIGTAFTFPVSVRNVPPVITLATVQDWLGHDLTLSSAFALPGQPVSLAVDFTDPGRPDTQTALVDWNDGTTNTTFQTFTDAFGGAVGHLRQTHAFTAPGTYAIVATITDDDLGATPVTKTIKVVTLKEALALLADQLTQMIANAANADIATALREARDDLIGNHGGVPPKNGALDKLDGNDPLAAITKVQSAISFLVQAESSGAGDLTALKDMLGLVAEGIATDLYLSARAKFPNPSPGQVKTLATIAALLAQGHQQLVAHQYPAACGSFAQAASKALNMLK
ncbi:MAG TPA: hypothetical protein VFW45_16780 [Candidatus Polarisedimenticolia bacterium]|nr:hypothetical protein [Candidatus Polarisedimenticolia bacterium]